MFTTNTDIELKGTSAMNTLGSLIFAATVAFAGFAAATAPVGAQTLNPAVAPVASAR